MQNQIELLLKRKSIRSYQNKKIEKEKIEELAKIANVSPTSINSQNFSCVFIQDQETKNFISEKCGNQKHIKNAPLLVLFLADSNRVEWILKSKNINYVNANNDLESMLFSFVDATIASTMVQDAAILLGLGTCYIGAVRFAAKEIKKYLNIEGKATPVVGLTIGYSDDNDTSQKPKINKVYYEKYNLENIHNEIIDYNETLNKYYLSRNSNNKDEDYIITVIKYYKFFDEYSSAMANHYEETFKLNKKK